MIELVKVILRERGEGIVKGGRLGGKEKKGVMEGRREWERRGLGEKVREGICEVRRVRE